jgi:hypothetical protein
LKAKFAVILMKMLPAQPFIWAKGTNFNPLYDDCNQITVKIAISNPEQLAKYAMLTAWMTENVNAGKATSVSLVAARQILNQATP